MPSGQKLLGLMRLDLRRAYIDIVDNKSPYTLPYPHHYHLENISRRFWGKSHDWSLPKYNIL